MRVTDSKTPLVTDRRSNRIPAEEVDFRLLIDGTIAILWPVSSEACGWVEDHLPPDCARWGSGYAIEFRYLGDILFGIDQDGLVIGSQR